MEDFKKQLEEVQNGFKASHEAWTRLSALLKQSPKLPENHERLTKLFSLLADDMARIKIVSAYAEASGQEMAHTWARVCAETLGAKFFWVYMMARREGYSGVEITLKAKE